MTPNVHDMADSQRELTLTVLPNQVAKPSPQANLILDHRVGRAITETDYHFGIRFPEDGIEGNSYRTHYVHHNGYTRIEAKFPPKDKFGEWFNLFNTRFQRSKKLGRFRRKTRIAKWTLDTLQQAYATYLTERPNMPNNKPIGRNNE